MKQADTKIGEQYALRGLHPETPYMLLRFTQVKRDLNDILYECPDGAPNAVPGGVFTGLHTSRPFLRPLRDVIGPFAEAQVREAARRAAADAARVKRVREQVEMQAERDSAAAVYAFLVDRLRACGVPARAMGTGKLSIAADDLAALVERLERLARLEELLGLTPEDPVDSMTLADLHQRILQRTPVTTMVFPG